MKRLIAVASLVGLMGCAGRVETPREEAEAKPKAVGEANAKAGRKKVVRTDEEWAKILPRESYLVTRTGATEQAGTGKYANYHGEGLFACIGCGTELFDGRAKYDSGTGWPSFFKAIDQNRLDIVQAAHDPIDFRTEVRCGTCDAHLGHVFDDGPPPTGLRFCINSVALSLVESADEGKSK